jgi:hypothetical protein
MKSGAEPHTSSVVRGAGLFDRIDYRLVESPEERDSIYLMRYRAYLHGGLICPSESLRVSDPYDDAPNAWIFGVYIDGELCSSLRVHVLTSDARMSYATELFGDVLHPRLDRGEVFVDPARFVADPEKSQRFQELPYLTVRLGYLACDYFGADTGLSLVRAEHHEEGGPDGVGFPECPGKDPGAVSHHAVERLRAADAVRPDGPATGHAASGAGPRPRARHRHSGVSRARGSGSPGVTGYPRWAKFAVQAVPDRLALTPARPLQVINHRDRFSAFVSI